VNELAAELPAAGVVRVIGPELAGAGFLVSANGLIVTCAHVLAGCAPDDTISIEPHVDRQSLSATVDLLQDPPDVAVLRLTAPVPPEAMVLPLGRTPRNSQPGLRTFGYPEMRPEAGLPGEVAFLGVTADDGYDQLALRSEEATLGFSGTPIWDPELGVVVGMVKSIFSRDRFQRLGNNAIGVPVEVIRALCPELMLPLGCPYRGLEPFTEEHVDYYYGREHATSQLLDSLGKGDFAPVVAVSGGGKSSLLQAGLAKGLRDLQDRPEIGLAQRIRCYQRVGGQPHAGLLHSLAQHGILLPHELAVAPAQELAAAIRGSVPPTGLIVVVDQFERLYTDCEDSERKRFIELLRHLATGMVKVVIGLRADFYHLALADLGGRLAAGQVALAPMSDEDLEQAIAAPAEKLLRSFQLGLTQRLVADVRGRPGDLPLLQFALTELWERDAAGGVLTKETYQSLGKLPDGTQLPGAQGALIRRAEQLWLELDPADQPRLQRILLGLIAVQPTESSTASPVTGTRDLGRPARLAQWDEEDQRLIQRLIDARLLTADRAPAGGQPTVEVSHEALLRAWPRLRSWLKERSEFVQWRAQDLAPNLERWLDSNKSREFLLPRSLLDPALQRLHNYPDELAGPPADYIQASKRHRTRRRGLLSGAVAVLVVASLAAAGIFYSLKQTADQQRNLATSAAVATAANQLYASNPALARQLSLAAFQLAPSPEAYGSLLNATVKPLAGQLNTTPGTDAEVFNADGSMLATSSTDAVQLWHVNAADPLDPTLVTTIHSARAIHSSPQLWFDPGNSTILAVLYGRYVSLEDIDHPYRFSTGKLTDTASDLAFSRNGRVMAIGYTHGSVQLWNVADPRNPTAIGRPFRAPGAPNNVEVARVVFSPDGSMLATVSGPIITPGTAESTETVRLWSLAHPAKPRLLPATLTSTTTMLAFSPVGHILATGSADNGAQLWNVTDPSHPARTGSPLSGHTGTVEKMAFSADGHILATASWDGSVRLWNVTDHTHPTALAVLGREPSMIVFASVAISPDGQLLAASGVGLPVVGKTWLWKINPRQAAAAVCAAEGSPTTPITQARWRLYFPGDAYSPPCRGA
jgi:hypothetical protein